MDESVFGIRDLAGSVSEFAAAKTMADYRFVVLRGGNWYTVDDYFFRAATRNGRLPEATGVDAGIRLVADLLAPAGAGRP
jgi:formylglycine-generating enzyme required for sulfatase activity